MSVQDIMMGLMLVIIVVAALYPKDKGGASPKTS